MRYRQLKEYFSQKPSIDDIQKIIDNSKDLRVDISEELSYLE